MEWLTADAGRAEGEAPLFGRDVFLLRTLIHSLPCKEMNGTDNGKCFDTNISRTQ